MTTAALFWVLLATLCVAYVVGAYCTRLEQSRDRKAVLLEDPTIRDDPRTDGLVEGLRKRGGL